MESKKQGGSAASFTSELFGNREPPSTGVFASIFPPPKENIPIEEEQGAQLVVLEGKNRNVWENVWSPSCLDLHLMSSGAARAMVCTCLLDIRSNVFKGQKLPDLLRFMPFHKKYPPTGL